MTCQLAVLDSKEECDRTPPGGLTGKMVLTRLGREAAFEFFQKLGVTNRTEAVVKGIEMGVISPQES